MTWFLVAFDKNTGEEVKLIHTVGIDDEFIKRVWSLPDDDPVIGACYAITPENVGELTERVQEPINLHGYNYQLWGEED